MADDEELIASKDVNKTNNKDTSLLAATEKEKPSTSKEPDAPLYGKEKLDNTNIQNDLAPAKNDVPSDNQPVSTAANLYHKFVSSFDAVLQNLATKEQIKGPLLSTFDIEGIAAYIKEEQPRNIIFMVGAGISTSAGIPDFRSPDTGLYDNLGKFNLPDPQAVFDVSFFKKNPEPFYVLARDLFHEDIKPTLCHYLIKLFDIKGILRRCFTQNIDALEYLADVSEDRVITAHGSYQTSTCQKSSCKKNYDREWLLAHLRNKEKTVARCDACGSVVKPDIVFFGEKLSNRFFSAALADFPKCDLLIIMGTSLVVQPFASLVQQVSKECPRLLINLVPVGTEMSGTFFNNGESGPLKYNAPDNPQDVFWQGTCDDGALKLARILGWEDELKALHKKGNLSLTNPISLR